MGAAAVGGERRMTGNYKQMPHNNGIQGTHNSGAALAVARP